MERQLQTLAVQRLSPRAGLFVLERQKLQQVGEEKNLSADETAFWNGAGCSKASWTRTAIPNPPSP